MHKYIVHDLNCELPLLELALLELALLELALLELALLELARLGLLRLQRPLRRLARSAGSK